MDVHFRVGTAACGLHRAGSDAYADAHSGLSTGCTNRRVGGRWRCFGSVAWKAPSYAGSYPMTHYRVISAPGGHGCLVVAPATICTVPGLTNGTAYTFTVQALNGAGWGESSAPSSPVTPSESKVVRLTLDQGRRLNDGRHDRIITGGTTTGVPAGAKLTPHIRYQGESDFSDGVTTITVQGDGTFTWTRQIRKGRGLIAYVSWQDTESNKVYWARMR